MLNVRYRKNPRSNGSEEMSFENVDGRQAMDGWTDGRWDVCINCKITNQVICNTESFRKEMALKLRGRVLISMLAFSSANILT